jgi:hypothetical protein
MNKTDHIKTIKRPTVTPLLLRALIILLEHDKVNKVIEILKTELNDLEGNENESNNK